MNTPKRRLGQDAAIALFLFSGLLAWELSGLDITVSRWFGGPEGFPWREAWLPSSVLHQGGRAFAWLVLALTTLGALFPLVPGPSRAARLRWSAMTLACAMLVSVLKDLSLTSCPWDLAVFGGSAAHVSHWAIGVRDGGPGHCFPSGHASAGFAFLSGYFLWRNHRPPLARTWLVAACMAGLVFGGAQVVRGAHLVSHVWWSGCLCWALCALGDALPRLVELPSAWWPTAPTSIRSEN